MKIYVETPGRVNLIGDHTDYNLGFVLPVAIDLKLQLSLVKTDAPVAKVIAENFNQEASFGPDDLIPPQREPQWLDYLKGVYWVLKEEGFPFIGSLINVKSNIPLGAGLSSSAALEVAVALALSRAGKYDISLKNLALLSQRAENDFVGVKCGIMDQFAVALAKKDHALLIDCKTLDYNNVPFQLGDYKLVIVDSRVNRSLVASAYNKRKEECEAAVSMIEKIIKRKVASLREVNIDDIKKVKTFMPPLLYKRSRYVVEENSRVLEAVSALKKNNLKDFGYLMKRSHAGLRDFYQVSSAELDYLVDLASSMEGVIGARMTGAGFGGCMIILARQEIIGKLQSTIDESYQRDFGLKPIFYITDAAGGAAVSESAP